MADLKDAKLKLKEAKATLAAAKKAVTPAMKAFLEEPDSKDQAKSYRGAVASHIQAARQVAQASARVEKLSDAA